MSERTMALIRVILKPEILSKRDIEVYVAHDEYDDIEGAISKVRSSSEYGPVFEEIGYRVKSAEDIGDVLI